MNKEKFDEFWKIATLVTLVTFFLLFVFMYRHYGVEGFSCIDHPLVYGAIQEAEEQENGVVICSCSSSGDQYYSTILFDSNSTIKETKMPNHIPN